MNEIRRRGNRAIARLNGLFKTFIQMSRYFYIGQVLKEGAQQPT